MEMDAPCKNIHQPRILGAPCTQKLPLEILMAQLKVLRRPATQRLLTCGASRVFLIHATTERLFSKDS